MVHKNHKSQTQIKNIDFPTQESCVEKLKIFWSSKMFKKVYQKNINLLTQFTFDFFGVFKLLNLFEIIKLFEICISF